MGPMAYGNYDQQYSYREQRFGQQETSTRTFCGFVPAVRHHINRSRSYICSQQTPWSPNLRLSTRKSEYTVQEAARVLEVSFDELRSLLIRHVLDEMDSIENIPKMRFTPADLVMLSLVRPAAKTVPATIEIRSLPAAISRMLVKL